MTDEIDINTVRILAESLDIAFRALEKIREMPPDYGAEAQVMSELADQAIKEIARALEPK